MSIREPGVGLLQMLLVVCICRRRCCCRLLLLLLLLIWLLLQPCLHAHPTVVEASLGQAKVCSCSNSSNGSNVSSTYRTTRVLTSRLAFFCCGEVHISTAFCQGTY